MSRFVQPSANVSKAARSRIKMLSDLIRIIWRLLKVPSKRVTVSLDEQII
jgi:hypothetical protein